MDSKNVSFERFTRAIADLKIAETQPRPTAHTASVVDFSNWDAVQRELSTAERVDTRTDQRS